jgi:hypothetical protein
LVNVNIDEFAGSWAYRSFYDRPELDATADDLLNTAGDLTLEAAGAGDTPAGLDLGGSKISGRVSFGDIYLTVSGTAVSGTAVSGTVVSGTAEPDKPPTIRYRATGVEGTPTAGWIYDFVGYLAPSWPRGEGQRPAIVGTAIRTVQHMGGVDWQEVRPAGATMSFIAVSRDHPADS